jgi:glutamyl-Q tRNA(Asp) synthetase
LAAALASWVDARAHNGKWLIRIENIDGRRERPGAAETQLGQLARLGMIADGPVLVQSTRGAAYKDALQVLRDAGRTYFCRCPRGRRTGADGDATTRPYPGTCRERGLGPPGATRFRVAPGVVRVTDRRHGTILQDVASAVGDFIVHRADACWAYQLAVVVDDAHQGITDVVRGDDLLDNTPRQIQLQQALHLPTPRYLHVALVRDAAGRKLSKHEQAPALAASDPLGDLERAWEHLGYAPTGAASVGEFLERAVAAWRACAGAAGPSSKAAATSAALEKSL